MMPISQDRHELRNMCPFLIAFSGDLGISMKAIGVVLLVSPHFVLTFSLVME